MLGHARIRNAGVLTGITSEIDKLVQVALNESIA